MAITSILVANRGEIACRVMRTARDLGIRTVAVFSDADARAPHVEAADAAIRIGPAPVAESYLNAKAVLEAARTAGADAIHPGYGFLSENAAFAQAVLDAGLTWIGPPPDAITVMGDKAGAKRAMIAAGVPCLPGYEGKDQSEATFVAAAVEIGFPVMVKASAGGGGRGMRMVSDPADLPASLSLAKSEAENAFGDGTLILEKAVQRPRHVEIQVFADAHGTTAHLGERDCSVQRRHQKVLEEAPCPVMTPELRDKMGAAAVEAARAVDYRGAGTVEFLLDDSGKFYFLEMNTRLQVEHPVTEMVTGLDLVALQIKVAEGAPLGLSQDEITLTGHAIEARLYAEDPEDDFLPSTGPISLWSPAPGIRTDAGIETGGEVSPHYDAMVAKLIAYGETRGACLRQLSAALEDTLLFGPRTNQAFLADAVKRQAFANGQATTAFIAEEYGDAGFSSEPVTDADLAAGAVIEHLTRQDTAQGQALAVPDELLDWSSTSVRPSMTAYQDGEGLRKVSVRPNGNGYDVAVGEQNFAVAVDARSVDGASLRIDGQPIRYRFLDTGTGELFLQRGPVTHRLTNRARQMAGAGEEAGGGTVTAPMHGKLLAVYVAVGDAVKKGDRLAVLEAMKMQHEILAEVDGEVTSVVASADTQIAADDLILEIAAEETA
ncbi:MAG: biotin carboxylase N-terminal domain-containing protein [Pseudomonadota bacterium]